MSFLKAEWRRLAIANYAVDAAFLKQFLPAKTELDEWNGIHYLSLVGFMFKNTKVLGLKIPLHINFEEVNLRFYVKYKAADGWRRGVVFVKEIVPKHAITFIANTLYKEHYQTMKMNHVWDENKDTLLTAYRWQKDKQLNSFTIESAKALTEIRVHSEAEFITEHYWGYTKVDGDTTYEYEVTHPKWEQYEVKSHEISVDFENSYGKQFDFLNALKPNSIMLAEGSPITVENKRKI